MAKQGQSEEINDAKHMFMVENELIHLLDLSEPIDERDLNKILQLVEDTSFNHLKVKLLEQKEEYVECLQLFVDSFKNEEYAGDDDKIENVFNWIQNILFILGAKREALNDDISIVNDENFRKQVKANFIGLINMDELRTYSLIQEFFQNQTEDFI